ncbi:ABC transporter substrate-binding protein [Sphingomonas sp. MMS24-JH45]
MGRSLANATQLALLDTRNQQVRITSYDTATGAAAAASRAIADGAQLILGPLLAEDVRVVAPIAKAAKVPVLSFSNDVGVAGNGTYVLGYAPAQAIERVVGDARGRGITTFGGLVPNALYGTRASTAFLRAVEQAGGRVVGSRPTTGHPPRSTVRWRGWRRMRRSGRCWWRTAARRRRRPRRCCAGRARRCSCWAPNCGIPRMASPRARRWRARGSPASPMPCTDNMRPSIAPASAPIPTACRAWAMTRCCWWCGSRATGGWGRAFPSCRQLRDGDGFAGIDGRVPLRPRRRGRACAGGAGDPGRDHGDRLACADRVRGLGYHVHPRRRVHRPRPRLRGGTGSSIAPRAAGSRREGASPPA